MTSLVKYLCEDSIATLMMDDGKVNVLSPQMLAELGGALDKAEAEAGVVILTGREGRFSGGFDLSILQGGGRAAIDMLDAGFGLAERLLRFPKPVVAACNGHAIAMASFLLNCVDYRVGAAGAYRITANEVTLGLTMPRAAVEICRQRLTPSHFHRAMGLAEVFSPAGAVEAGFLDEAVEPGELGSTAHARASQMLALDPQAHAETKLRTREHALDALVAARAADNAELEQRLIGS
ncbi:MAG TPA: crotonase/enoyl-CoA hydratase family protein [Frankiaceae bacterium]|nr:crotonase/enoyl-CoA hydratase family protein [Frankiaceae bacterium]